MRCRRSFDVIAFLFVATVLFHETLDAQRVVRSECDRRMMGPVKTVKTERWVLDTTLSDTMVIIRRACVVANGWFMATDYKRYFNQSGVLMKEEYLDERDSVLYTFEYNYRNDYLCNILETDSSGAACNTLLFYFGGPTIDVVTNENIVDAKTGKLIHASTYKYDHNLNLIRAQHVDSTGMLDHCCTTQYHAYDDRNQLVRSEYDHGDGHVLVYHYTYDSLGRKTARMEVSIHRGDSTSTMKYYWQSTFDKSYNYYSYNADGQLTEERCIEDFNRVSIRAYTYHPNGNVQTVNSYFIGSHFSVVHAYDKYENELSMITIDSIKNETKIILEYRYRYDRFGNWIYKAKDADWLELRDIEYYE